MKYLARTTPLAFPIVLFATQALAQTAEPEQVAPAEGADSAVEQTAAPELPSKLQVGDEGVLKVSALMQAWFFFAAQDKDTTSTFRVRRAEIGVSGHIIPDRFKYKLKLDPSKALKFKEQTVPVQNQTPPPAAGAAPEQVSIDVPAGDTASLQDLYLTAVTDYADVSVGQFKVPVGWEGPNSSSKLVLPERAMATRYFSDDRDIGLRAAKEFDSFGYVVGVFNGAGPNRRDNNDQKNLGLRLELYPIDGLSVAGSGLVAVGERDDAGTRDVAAADLHLELSDALVQAEYFRAWEGGDGTGRTASQGGYLAVGYTFDDTWMPVLRAGLVDQDLDTDGSSVTHYEAGVNYFVLDKQVKFQASYGLFDPDASGVESRHEATLVAQLAF